MYKCIIVDDEELAIKRLVKLLDKHSRNYQIEATFINANDMLDYLKENEVDVIFLDIEMPELNGLEAIKKVSSSIKVIYVTAYKDYAIDAFENDAFDYLLKPISQERFDKAILKLQAKSSSNKEYINPSYPLNKVTQIPVKRGDKTLFIDVSNIAYFKTDTKYSEINTLAGDTYLIPNTLTAIEQKLEEFMRVHKGLLVNKNHIQEIRKYFNSKVKIYMNDKNRTCLISGRTYIDNINQLKTF